MPLATITPFSILPTHTAASLANAISDQMLALGFELVASITGATERRIWSYEVNPLAAKNKVFLELSIGSTAGSNLQVSIGDGYNPTGEVFQNGNVNSSAFTWAAASTYQGVRIAHPEIRMVCLNYTVDNYVCIGFVRPQTKASFWNEDAYLYAFKPIFSTAYDYNSRLEPPTLNPWNSSSVYAGPVNGMQEIPPLGPPQILKATPLIGVGTGAANIWGQFSADVASCSVTGLDPGATFEHGVEVYQLVLDGGSTDVAIAVRIL